MGVLRACLLATVAALATASPAVGDVTIMFPTGVAAGPYQEDDVTIAAGQSVTWQGSFAYHPLVSDTGAFATVSSGTSFTQAFAVAGTYGFHCMLHASMTGVVRVSSAYPPPPPPLTPTPSSPPPGPAPAGPGSAADLTAPGVAVTRIDTRALRARGLLLRFRSSERGSAEATLTARGRTLARARTTYARPGAHVLRLRLTKRGRALLRRHPRVRARLRLTVRDAAGNAKRVSRTVRLRV